MSSPLGALGIRFLVALLVATAITAGGLWAALWYAEETVAAIPRIDIPRESFAAEPDAPANPGNYLIVGSDTRAFVETAADAESFGTEADQGGQRSDTMMVVHVDPEGDGARVIQFPRDLLVDIPGRGEAMINSAYAESADLLVLTVIAYFDIPIHHYLEIDFASFRDIVDAIGGVDIYVPYPARDAWTGLDIAEGGCITLDGEEALSFARSRHFERFDAESGVWREDPRADIGRVARQQYFLRFLADQAVGATNGSPLAAKRLVDAIVPNLGADKDLDLRDVTAFISAFIDVDVASVPVQTIPFVTAPENRNRLRVDWPAAEPILAEFRSFGEAPAATDTFEAAGRLAARPMGITFATQSVPAPAPISPFFGDPAPGLPSAANPDGSIISACPPGT